MPKVGPPPTDWKSSRWWRNRTVEERTTWANIPQRWLPFELSELDLPAPVLEKASAWVESYSPGSDGLLIMGSSRTGKTVLATCILKELIRSHSVSGRFVSADRYVEMLKDQFDNNNELPEMYAIPHLVKYLQGVFDIVLLDGLGEERLTDFAKQELGSLLRHRYEDCNATIVTTSETPTDIVRRYGTRISGTIEGLTRIVL
jgi:DNA replication protein DnaC